MRNEKENSALRTPNSELVKTLRAGDGFLSQSSKWLHFGLGSADAVERVTVRWPDGTIEDFAGMVADRRYRIVQSSGNAEPWQGPVRKPHALRPEPLVGSPTTQTASLVSVGALPLPPIEYDTFAGNRRPVVPSHKDEPGAVLLNLWASWCEPCLHELKEFTDAEDRIRAAGVEIVVLSVDGLEGHQDSSAETAQQLIAKIGFPFRSGSAYSSAIEKLQWCTINSSTSIGVLLQSEGRHRDAIRQFQQALERGADPFHTHSNMGRSYLAQHQRELAIDHFRRALKFNPDDGRAVSNLARALAMVGNINEAAVHFRRAVELNPDDIRALRDLARALTLSGNFKEATIHLRRVLELQPDDAAAHAYLGAALLDQDELDAAIRHLRRAVELKPDFPKAHQYLATALKKAGQLEEANRHLEEMRRLQNTGTAQ